MNTKQLIDKAVSLPVEERALVADSLLRSLNQPESEIDREWAAVANRRLAELRSGSVKAVSGREVFEKIWKKFDKRTFLFTRRQKKNSMTLLITARI